MSRSSKAAFVVLALCLSSSFSGPAHSQTDLIPNMDMDCEHDPDAAYASILRSYGLTSPDGIGRVADKLGTEKRPDLAAIELNYLHGRWKELLEGETRALEALDAFEKKIQEPIHRWAMQPDSSTAQIGRVGDFLGPAVPDRACLDDYRNSLKASIAKAGPAIRDFGQRATAKLAEACGLQLEARKEQALIEGKAPAPAGALAGKSTVTANKREENFRGYTASNYASTSSEWVRQDTVDKVKIRIRWEYENVPTSLTPGQTIRIQVKGGIVEESPPGAAAGITLSGVVAVFGDIEVKSGQPADRSNQTGVYELVVKPDAKSAEIHLGGYPMGTTAIWKYGN